MITIDTFFTVIITLIISYIPICFTVYFEREKIGTKQAKTIWLIISGIWIGLTIVTICVYFNVSPSHWLSSAFFSKVSHLISAFWDGVVTSPSRDGFKNVYVSGLIALSAPLVILFFVMIFSAAKVKNLYAIVCFFVATIPFIYYVPIIERVISYAVYLSLIHSNYGGIIGVIFINIIINLAISITFLRLLFKLACHE